MVFTFYFTGDLSYDEITNVHPLFGSDGGPVPEPSTFILFLSGTGLLAGAARFKRKISVNPPINWGEQTAWPSLPGIDG